MALFIGKLDKKIDKIAASVLAAKKLKAASDGWRKCPEKIDVIDNLNLASICLFTDHVKDLEGLPHTQEGMDRSKFKTLPGWMYCVWLPIEFNPPKEPPTDASGFPVFVGGCQGLLADLEKVKKMSKWNLGTIPAGYETMRKDMKAFYKIPNFRVEGNEAIAQWIWRALFDAATVGIEKSVPVFGCFD